MYACRTGVSAANIRAHTTINTTAAQKALLGLVGSLTVATIGFLGRAVKDERTGLIAATIAAFYPMLWLPDAALMSETTSMLFTALGDARRP